MRWNESHHFEAPDDRRGPAQVSWPDLHICPACERTFVVPRAVLDVVGPDRYLVDLRCTNCGWAGVSAQGELRLEALDREMDRHIGDMREALELAAIVRRMEEIDAFALALQQNLILPEDF